VPLALFFGLRLGGLTTLLQELLLREDLLAEHQKHLLGLLIEAALDGLPAERVVDTDLRGNQGLAGPLGKILDQLVLHVAGDLLAKQAHHQVNLRTLLDLCFRTEFGSVDLVEELLPVVF
jgi:hypothetical protein